MKNQVPSRAHAQRGSVFILIFVMIALFGALSFVMVQSFRGGDATISKDKARLAATEIVGYLNKIRDSVTELRINGCDPVKINFNTTKNIRYNNTVVDIVPPVGTSDNCHMFTKAGAGLTAQNFAAYADQTIVAAYPEEWRPGHLGARYVDSGLGSPENDLAYMTSGIKKEVCLAIMAIITGKTATEIPYETYESAGTHSSTQGAAGSLDSIATISGTNMYITRTSPTNEHCSLGIVAYVR